jgi:hypothetical protein
MNLKENIKKVLKEETSLQSKLQNMIDTKGIDFASNVVGGMKNFAKILNLDLDDIDTQEMLVKNFLYHVEIDEIDISFLEVRNSSNGKIIKAYFKTTSGAANITSWFDREVSDYLTKELFPFRVAPSWEPAFANKNVKIFLDSEVISDEENNEEELTEKWTEKYKRSINCNNPKGFSQKAHCAGKRKKNEIDEYSRTLKNARRQGSGLRFPKSAVKSNPMRFRKYNVESIIKKELNRIFDYERGRVISEQKTPPQLGKDGCQKGYYRSCETKECTPIPPNTKITYSQKNYDVMTKVYGQIEKLNEIYEKQLNDFYQYEWNEYLNDTTFRTLDWYDKKYKQHKAPQKFYTFTDFNDFKRKLSNGYYTKIPNIPINKPLIDWINKIPDATQKKLIIDGWVTKPVKKNDYDYYRPKLFFKMTEARKDNMYVDQGSIQIDRLDFTWDKWKSSSAGILLYPLIDKMYEILRSGTEGGTPIILHFKTPPNVILGCESGETITNNVITPTTTGTTTPTTTDTKTTGTTTPITPIEQPKPTVNPDYPEYTLQYKKKKYLDVKLPQNKIKRVFDRGVLDTPGRFRFSEKDPKEIAKYKKYYEGYDDEEGNHIPGEIEKAQQQNRQIKFLDPISKDDELAQQRYKEEYAQYKKNLSKKLYLSKR